MVGSAAVSYQYHQRLWFTPRNSAECGVGAHAPRVPFPLPSPRGTVGIRRPLTMGVKRAGE